FGHNLLVPQTNDPRDREATVTERPSDRTRGVSRRAVLRVGGLAALGQILAGRLDSASRAGGVAATGAGRPIRACILVFHYGGPGRRRATREAPRSWPCRTSCTTS